MKGIQKTFSRDYRSSDTKNSKLYSNIDKKHFYCYCSFHKTCTSIPHKHVLTKNIMRSNNNLCMTKTIRKPIMLRSRLKTKCNKKEVKRKLGKSLKEVIYANFICKIYQIVESSGKVSSLAIEKKG